MTKHVVNIVPAFVPGDGIGNSARARVAGQLDSGYRVSVICATAKVHAGEFPGLKLMQAGGGWEADRSSLTDEMFATVHSADLLFVEFGCFNICHELLENASAPIILFYQGLTPATLMHSDMYTSCYWRAIGELRKMPKPALVLAASQFTLDEYTRIAGPFAGPMKVVPLFGNAVASKAGSHAARLENTLKILTVGQLFPHKNYEVLIDAAKILTAEGVSFEIRHIGGANDLVANAYRERLMQLAKPLGNKFQFLGKVEQSALENNYRDCDVVVIPSLHEGYSLPAREALLYGKAVVASTFGALPETLQGAAEHFHPLDAHELAVKLRMVAEWNSVEWETARTRALEKAPCHSKEMYVQNCVEAIQSMLAFRSAASDVPIERPLSESTHVMRAESNALLCGTIALQSPPTNVDRVGLEALVLADGQILRARVPARVSWGDGQGNSKCTYELSLVGCSNWTSLCLSFVDTRCGERLLEQPMFRHKRQAFIDDSSTHSELQRLVDSVTASYGPKYIQTADSRLVTRLKTYVANTVLRLVYQVFIGPQMATMQSQIRLFQEEVVHLRAELQRLSVSREPEQECERENEQQRLT